MGGCEQKTVLMQSEFSKVALAEMQTLWSWANVDSGKPGKSPLPDPKRKKQWLD